LSRWALICICFITINLIAGCASSTRVNDPKGLSNQTWNGRLSVKVLSTPVQAFSSQFELSGTAQSGSLIFTSLLGSTLARLNWDEQVATLQTTGEPQQFESIAALVRHATGADLPIAALFGWLEGIDMDTPEWKADLSELSIGRLQAQRHAPAPAAVLKIILDR
jgi:outer membrane lipoprotein LolB